ncbi:endolytic transglycosylase MltG [Patescibacteria group bacterium]|nr:endolytic transglycosylase MltG [Patescibacteria group bacterium]
MLRLIQYLILIIIIITGLVYFFYTQEIKTPINQLDEDIEFIIERGESMSTIANNLVSHKIIKSPLYFKFYIWKQKLGSKFQAGAYRINSSKNITEIVDIFVNGKTFGDQTTIKLIEGWSNYDIKNYLLSNNISSEDAITTLEKPITDQISQIKDFNFLQLAPKTATLEGYLFPDTYKIYKNATLNNILIKILAHFESKISTEMLADIEKQGKSLHEVIIMASLIEKEVQSAEDMKIVSAIFWNRLNQGMRLESDATLSYLLKDKKSAHSLSDLKIDSPYNSYKYTGLPPTPISNPGINAIVAAIYPAKSDYLFFLTGNNNKTYFAKTYAEHLSNKNKYLK